MGTSQSRQPSPSSVPATPLSGLSGLSEPSDAILTPPTESDEPSTSFHRGRASKRGRSAAASLSSMASLAKGKRRKSTEEEDESGSSTAPALRVQSGSADIDMTPSLRPDGPSTRPRSRPSSFLSTRTDSSRGGTMSRAISRLRPTSMRSTSTAPGMPPPSPSSSITPSLPTSPGPPVPSVDPIAASARPPTPLPQTSTPVGQLPSQADLDTLDPDIEALPLSSLPTHIASIESSLGPQIHAIFTDTGENNVDRTSSVNLIRLSDHITSTRAREGRNESHEAMHQASARLLRLRLRLLESDTARSREENRRLRAEAVGAALDDALDEAHARTTGQTARPPAGAQLGGTSASGIPRVPAGAVLVIQGLVQTHHLEEEIEADGSGGSSDALALSRLASAEPATARSAGESSGSRPRRSRRLARRASRNGPEDREASLEAQVRTIGNLVNVAAAAISTTLLTPENSPHPRPRQNRPSIANTITSFFERFRPGRRNVNVEAAISNYLRNALRNSSGNYTNASSSGAALPDSSEDGPTVLGHENGQDGQDLVTHVSEEFREFLEGLQRDLVDALNEFARPETTEPEVIAPTADTRATSTLEEVDSPSAPVPPISTDETTEPPTPGGEIPAFHAQPGQTTATPHVRSSVSPGLNGQPRRLNFFRAHLFPAVRASDPSTPARPEDSDGMVPCVFIGVQSINAGRNMTTEEMINHPSFPFIDGQVPPDTAPPPTTTTTVGTENEVVPDSFTPVDQPQTQEEAILGEGGTSGGGTGRGSGSGDITSFLNQWSDPDPPRLTRSASLDAPSRSLRSRLGRIISPRQPTPPAGPTNTYLVYVIGGNYPQNHPILRIPALMTGEPLTDEDMTLIGELLGSVKPPIATKDEIEKAGLKIVRGEEMEGLGKTGEVLDNCVERCLVCLSEYEPQDECRVLNCRHAYHKDCVDQWLSQGRNSCPACRTEAVVKPSAGAAETPSQEAQANAAVGAMTETTENTATGTAESAEGEGSAARYNTNLLDVD